MAKPAVIGEAQTAAKSLLRLHPRLISAVHTKTTPPHLINTSSACELSVQAAYAAFPEIRRCRERERTPMQHLFALVIGRIVDLGSPLLKRTKISQVNGTLNTPYEMGECWQIKL